MASLFIGAGSIMLGLGIYFYYTGSDTKLWLPSGLGGILLLFFGLGFYMITPKENNGLESTGAIECTLEGGQFIEGSCVKTNN